jgi:triosephosphate isomerase
MNLPPEGIDLFIRAFSEVRRDDVDLAVAPPFPFLYPLAAAISEAGSPVAIGGQNCSDRTSGAFTGEVSASMLKSAGASYVIVGHSERRQIYGETSRLVGKKVHRVLADGLVPVMCVGEEQHVRDAGRTAELLEEQLSEAAQEIGEFPPTLVIAYEPVWAIGTGKTATPEIAADAHRLIRNVMKEIAPSCALTILYGGSVTPENAATLSAEKGIDGFLVGGASLSSEKFSAILRGMLTAARA